MVMQCTFCSSLRHYINSLSCPSAMFPEVCHTQTEPSVLQKCVSLFLALNVRHIVPHTTFLATYLSTVHGYQTVSYFFLFVQSITIYPVGTQRQTQSVKQPQQQLLNWVSLSLILQKCLCCGDGIYRYSHHWHYPVSCKVPAAAHVKQTSSGSATAHLQLSACCKTLPSIYSAERSYNSCRKSGAYALNIECCLSVCHITPADILLQCTYVQWNLKSVYLYANEVLNIIILRLYSPDICCMSLTECYS
jgi:hypothetical protein